MAAVEPLTTYDYLVRTRRQVLDAVRSLGAEAYAREFPVGLGTLGRTLTHIMISEWFYVQRLEARDVPSYSDWPIRDEHPPALDELEAAWAAQADATRAALAAVRDWSAPIEYRAEPDDGPPLIVSATAGGLFTQLVLHEVHHRAQALNILRRLDTTLGDLDYNATMFTRRPAE